MARSIAEIEHSTVRKVSKRLIPFLFLCFAISILDRLNISFAALQMNETLNFSNEVYGLGAGIFFIGYFLLEVPGGALMTKFGARKWISRIMISWVSSPVSRHSLRLQRSFMLFALHSV
jgi:ACS family tartrate transporter-like MFS transporter